MNTKNIQYHLLYTIPNLHHAVNALTEVPELTESEDLKYIFTTPFKNDIR